MDRAPTTTLTPRESEILALVAAGRRTPEIASTLAIAPATVETIVASAVHRLGARSRRHAMALVSGAGASEPLLGLGVEEVMLVVALAGGATMLEAAARAGVSLRTAHRRLAALRMRLGSRTTAQAIAELGQISTTTGRISGRFDARL